MTAQLKNDILEVMKKEFEGMKKEINDMRGEMGEKVEKSGEKGVGKTTEFGEKIQSVLGRLAGHLDDRLDALIGESSESRQIRVLEEEILAKKSARGEKK